MTLSITEQLSYATVRIECEYNNGGLGTGTGYFFIFKDDKASNTHIPVVITNKHVINGALKGKLIFSKKNEHGEPLDREHFGISIDNFRKFLEEAS